METTQKKTTLFFFYLHQKPATLKQFVAHWQNRCAECIDVQTYTSINAGSFNRISTHTTRFNIQCFYSKRYYGKTTHPNSDSTAKLCFAKQHPFSQLKQKKNNSSENLSIFYIYSTFSHNSKSKYCYCDNFISWFLFQIFEIRIISF